MNTKYFWVLILSIALNVFVIGLFVGRYSLFTAKEHFGMEHKSFTEEDGSFQDNLKVFKTMEDLRKQSKGFRKEKKEVRGQIAKILSAPEFDSNAFEKAVEQLIMAQSKETREIGKKTALAVKQLTQEERIWFAKHFPMFRRKEPPHKPGRFQ